MSVLSIDQLKKLSGTLHNEFETTHKIIDQREMGPLSPYELYQNYTDYGSKFLDLLKVAIEVLKLYKKIEKAKQEISYSWLNSDIELSSFTDYSVGAKWRLGAGAIAARGWRSLREKGVQALFIETSFMGASGVKHAFVLLGISKEDVLGAAKIHRCFIPAIFKSLKQGILFDPMLNVVCPISKLPIDSFWNFQTVNFVVGDLSEEQWRSVLERVDTIYEKVQEIGPSLDTELEEWEPVWKLRNFIRVKEEEEKRFHKTELFSIEEEGEEESCSCYKSCLKMNLTAALVSVSATFVFYIVQR